MRRTGTIVLTALMALPIAGAGASRSPDTFGSIIEREVLAAAERAGISADAALDAVQELEFVRADGTAGVRAITTRELIRRFETVTTTAAPGMAEGVPEILAGDLTHAYLEIGIGVSTRYSVTTSAVVPATPPVAVAEPTTGLPLFTEYGGPLLQVKGGGWPIGGHSAGYALGGVNVDLAEGGPYVAPVAVALLTDETIDFVGHGSVDQVCIRIPFFGCIAAVGLLIGDGAALFDSELPADVPVLP